MKAEILIKLLNNLVVGNTRISPNSYFRTIDKNNLEDAMSATLEASTKV
jgi:hypothetical protein